MDIDTIIFLIRLLSKAFGLSSRIYEGGKSIYYYSATHVLPDPAMPEQEAINNLPQTIGVYTTTLFQLYGFYKVREYTILVGPTAAAWEDGHMMDGFLFALGVSGENRMEYLQKLDCAPEMSVERMALIINLLATSVTGQPCSLHDIEVLTSSNTTQKFVTTQAMCVQENEDEAVHITVMESYRVEKHICHLIEQGELELLSEFLNSIPCIVGGAMADNTLRQTKNEFICTATLSSRAAIAGGMDMRAAFRLSDIYIQKSELMHTQAQVIKLKTDLMLDYAKRVNELKHGIATHSKLFDDCARLVARNIFTRIKVEDIALELHMSRAYLCTQFKQVSGVGLSQYITQVKIYEAQRLLCFTDRSIADIGFQLAFSSQSHFQNTFKKETGETPLIYRQKKAKLALYIQNTRNA